MTKDIYQKLDSLIVPAYFSSKDAHELCFKEHNNKTNEILAGIRMSEAMSYISTAEAIYFENKNLVESLYFDELFFKFHVFKKEIINNIVTDHSHQWTNIEFLAFKEAFKKQYPDVSID